MKKILIVCLSLIIVWQLAGTFYIARAYAKENIQTDNSQDSNQGNDLSQLPTDPPQTAGALEEGAAENVGVGANLSSYDGAGESSQVTKEELMPLPKIQEKESIIDWDPSVIINNDDIYTNTQDVNLTIFGEANGQPPSEMRIRNEGDPEWTDADWIPYNTSESWTLSLVDGTKTVYIQFKLDDNPPSDVESDSIILDRIAPQINIDLIDGAFVRGDVSISATTIDENEILPGSLVLEIVGTSIIETSFPYVWDTTSYSDGPYIVSFEAFDLAGNLGTASVTLNVDNTLPEVDKADFIILDDDDNLIGPGQEVIIAVYMKNPEDGTATGTFNGKNLTWALVPGTWPGIPPYFQAVYKVGENDPTVADAQLAASITDLAGNISNLFVINSGIAIDTTPPAGPISISVIGGTDNIRIDWSASNSSDVVGYNVYRASSPYQKINQNLIPASVTTYIDKDVEQGIKYYYKITAVDDAGNETDLALAVPSQIVALTEISKVMGQIFEPAAKTQAEGFIPKVEAAPVEGKVKAETTQEKTAPESQEEGKVTNWPMIIALIIAGLIIVAGIWYWWVITRPMNEAIRVPARRIKSKRNLSRTKNRRTRQRRRG